MLSPTDNPKALYDHLQEDDLFRRWKKEHQDNYLTHFFSSLDSHGEQKTSWEIGFYDPKDNKITIFVALAQGGFEIKPEDDIFKRSDDQVEALNIEKVKIDIEKAIKVWKEKAKELFPKEVFGDGFIILQNIKNKTLWNFTFITKTVKFANLKIDASSGNVVMHQTVNLVDNKNA